MPQDKLGVLIGLDEGCSSARISRYESGIHEPPFPVSERLAKALEIPVAYLYCPDEDVAALLLGLAEIPKSQKSKVLRDVLDVVARYSSE